MSALVKDGFLFIKSHEDDIYEVIKHKKNLGPVILNIIRNATKPLGSTTGTVKRGYILARLAEMEMYRTVPQSVVLQSLRLLEESSEIYEVGNGAYKCF